MSSVQAQCRVCGSSAPAEQFKLHHDYKQVVCQNCYSGKTKAKKAEEAVAKKEEIPRPPGWDEVDDYLEKAARQRQKEPQSQFSKIEGTHHLHCKCSVCKYSFRYNPLTSMPRTCPYCNTEVPKVRTYNLL
ncbi:hypothetical protein J4421_05325 [Candidatus Woesearchaeota archaeon]|nr:hypothetical protein [Candidatus Woesearchaeota archaeon]